MTRKARKELSQLYYLNREIEQDKVRLAELEHIATDTTAKITGLPHSTMLADKTAMAAEIADLRNEIEAKVKLTVVEYNRLMRFINKVEDVLIRQILILRHIEGLRWRQIAKRTGGANTEKSLAQMYYRFLEKVF